jgi:WD40 repeat protein
MPKVQATKDYIVLSVGPHFLVKSLKTGAISTPATSNHTGEITTITPVTIVKGTPRIASVDSDKKLVVWEFRETGNIVVVGSTFVRKKAVSVFFETMFGTDALIVALSHGEVGAFPLDGLNQRYKTLVSHSCSMITCACMSVDRRYLITTDRDEQVRVTNFPNNHSIQSFCMGHTAFVTHVIPSSAGHIISCGGDGTVRCFKPENGEELGKCDFSDVQELKVSMEDSTGAVTRGVVVRSVHFIGSDSLLATFDGTRNIGHIKLNPKTGTLDFVRFMDLKSHYRALLDTSTTGDTVYIFGETPSQAIVLSEYRASSIDDAKYTLVEANTFSSYSKTLKAWWKELNDLKLAKDEDANYHGFKKTTHKRKLEVRSLP